MKQLFFFLSIFVLLISCNNDDNVKIEYINDKSDYQLTFEEVKSIALEFLNSETKNAESFNIIDYQVKDISIPKFQTNLTTVPDEIIPVYELVTESNGKKGYSIIIGDSRIRKVLISVKQGSPSDTIYNEPLRTYFRAIPEIVRSNLIKYYNTLLPTPTTKKTEVITYYAFLPTIWAQGGPYNSKVPYLCPNRSDGRAPAGCVPIAIAQVLAYYRMPSNLDWDSILSSKIISNDSPQTVIDQVANLLVDIGVSVNINYDCNASGVNSIEYQTKVPSTFHKYGLNCSSFRYFSIYTVAWSLSLTCPVVLSGWSDNIYGHAWVCDGYKKTIYDTAYYEYLSMNWGWGGNSNGFFYVENPPAFQTGSYIWSNLGMITEIKVLSIL